MANLAQSGNVAMREEGERPSSSLRTDWITILLSIWFLGGLFLDGWAHNNLSASLESFFTPWHAVFYSGFMVVAAYHAWLMWQNHHQGYAWLKSLPQGYELSFVGLIIFSAGGVGDMLWHEILGIETGIEALFSPTHLLLATGIALLVAGPLRSSGYRLKTNTADWHANNWRTLFPMILSLTFLLSLFTFMAQFAYAFTHPWVLLGQQRFGLDAELRQITGMMGAMLHSGLLMGLLLPTLRRWRLPVGTLTFVLTINAALMSVMQDEFLGMGAAVLTGIISDILLLKLHPSAQNPDKFRLFAFLLPFTLYSLFIITVEIVSDSWWSIHMLTGLPLLAGLVGFLLSYVTLPPPSLLPTD
jgi:hypothetical protein